LTLEGFNASKTLSGNLTVSGTMTFGGTGTGTFTSGANTVIFQNGNTPIVRSGVIQWNANSTAVQFGSTGNLGGKVCARKEKCVDRMDKTKLNKVIGDRRKRLHRTWVY
jgi:hypothetical protein